ncbi:MAG: PH domain-containing protein [Polyangiaceae bacterium]
MPNDLVRAIERPSPKLLTLYLLRAFLSGPAALVMLPILYFRYQTMRYRFDDEGVMMSWGVLFHREIRLTYARIQDLHIVSGILQRWLGLADIHVQTASGSARAEMTIEGLLEYEAVRDALYERMRGARGTKALPAPSEAAPSGDRELVAALREVAAEVRATREALERLGGQGASADKGVAS